MPRVCSKIACVWHMEFSTLFYQIVSRQKGLRRRLTRGINSYLFGCRHLMMRYWLIIEALFGWRVEKVLMLLKSPPRINAKI